MKKLIPVRGPTWLKKTILFLLFIIKSMSSWVNLIPNDLQYLLQFANKLKARQIDYTAMKFNYYINHQLNWVTSYYSPHSLKQTVRLNCKLSTLQHFPVQLHIFDNEEIKPGAPFTNMD